MAECPVTPIHFCLISEALREMGNGYLVLARKGCSLEPVSPTALLAEGPITSPSSE